MRIYVSLNHDIEHSDVLGVYRTSEAAWKQSGCNGVEVYNLDDVDEGEPLPIGLANVVELDVKYSRFLGNSRGSL